MTTGNTNPTQSGADFNEPALWKEDWPKARQAQMDWWAGTGLALWVTSPKDEPWENIPAPAPPANHEIFWLDPQYRLERELYRLSHTFFGGVAAPIMNTDIGPGSLGFYLGAKVVFDEDTVWSEPVFETTDQAPLLAFDPEALYWKKHLAIYEAALKNKEGRYLVGFPDLIENIDTLSQLRGAQAIMWDLIENPDWVDAKMREVNQAFFGYAGVIWDMIQDEWGGSNFACFDVWGPGKTFKVQCDFCCMISPKMFKRHIMPVLDEQCRWMDNVMFHLDGSEALPQLDNILSMDSIHAIEWTPTYGQPWGGDPMWYDLYRKIKDAGKSVQAVFVEPEEVEPLIDAVGGEGMFIMTKTKTEAEARALLERCGWS